MATHERTISFLFLTCDYRACSASVGRVCLKSKEGRPIVQFQVRVSACNRFSRSALAIVLRAQGCVVPWTECVQSQQYREGVARSRAISMKLGPTSTIECERRKGSCVCVGGSSRAISMHMHSLLHSRNHGYCGSKCVQFNQVCFDCGRV